MTANLRWGLLLLGAAALAVWLLSDWSPTGTAKAAKAPPSGLGDAVWRQGYPSGHVHLCPPGDIPGGPLAGPHPLYRRPQRCGHHRTGLIDYGWDWILDPPSEWDYGNQVVS